MDKITRIELKDMLNDIEYSPIDTEKIVNIKNNIENLHSGVITCSPITQELLNKYSDLFSLIEQEDYTSFLQEVPNLLNTSSKKYVSMDELTMILNLFEKLLEKIF